MLQKRIYFNKNKHHFFNINSNKKWIKHQISILYLFLKDREDDRKFNFDITGINYILKYTRIVILNCNNIS